MKYWREGIAREVEVAAGPLDVAIDPRPAAAFVRARRESNKSWWGCGAGRTPGSPAPAARSRPSPRLFSDGGATTLLGARACEATVQGLARSGKLKGYRYLHFATHGQSDPRFAYRTALILAPDPDSGGDPTATESDGTITAEQIARTWELDADLVVLSACESGLGVAAGAEGYLGFAQPLFARGARSLVLSQWKVDDDATALLMARFYRNLLGKREGLTAPMPKAEALAEAKRWLRGAGPAEVGAALASLPRGEIVRREPVKAASPAHPVRGPDLLGRVRPGRGAGLRADPGRDFSRVLAEHHRAERGDGPFSEAQVPPSSALRAPSPRRGEGDSAGPRRASRLSRGVRAVALAPPGRGPG